MPKLETYKKQAKLLVRWHRDRNFSIGGRIRQLPRYQTLSDREALALKFPLTEAQEIIALEAGFPTWAALKASTEATPPTPGQPVEPAPATAKPVLYVADVNAAATFYQDQLGFHIDWLHGNPPFYGSVTRNGATLHLKLVHEPIFAAGALEQEGLIMAFIETPNVRQLYAEYLTTNAEIVQKLTKQAWGGTDFILRDPDGNTLAFAG
ncbi:glyoxalase/bleomycin resistance/extradiol dioxygenase family protein [Kribbella sandramycini]|uniref:Catechol 2,3-dioxygenase-like lactoylglutathione lyase family enzyme n=1 Tax=Kribbella sandramycini TaxID=60450 RepID=A0A7Y4P003_9ACTN|nr:glyoxalase superfamily protein [Kribbella sandramycini]MBB6565877.1 catechol 2,3-dioxygenase-like lactoylglutathione lyase family enzyme [Kribbella sandramycini]NOL42141.1 glyoxalase/bleomycin resistance/extradiol dioxygenase family protein [Kribbella sandramycini]